jgi:tripartite-type tricarboxylate transporter receptor subunit TctC
MNRAIPAGLFAPLLAALALGSGLAAAPAAATDDYPSKPLKLIVPFPPGGAADAVGRTYAERLSAALKQSVVVENKPGAGTAIAAEAAAKAAPDGYTLSLAPVGQLAVLPHLNKKIPYDPLHDFTPVSNLASVAYVIAAHPSLPANTLKELAALARAQPGKLSYSSCGTGTVCHLTGELFKSQAGIDLLHVPYKGSAPAITALLAGEVSLAFDTLTVIAPQVKAGRVKALAVTSRERSPLLPDVPTAIEAGFAHVEASSWFGIVVPAATPENIVKRLNAELNRIATLQEVREKLAAQGLTALNTTPEKFSEQIRTDYAKWGKVVLSSGATLD